ncbi:alpha/beta hydrolase [Phaeovulum sp. W22_SRMD_FR3]|uniref:alpha/beta hydrolase n=1 Tax=Phaeovulum sp. W22_SRMD_FR3 TaxID=3240274 RepID=UPI003F97D8F3
MSVSPALVILLHGVGSKGADMAGLVPLLAAALPGVAFAAPDGPELFSGGGSGRQWFSVAGISDESRPTRVAKGREAFDATLCAIIADHGLSAEPGRVALVGFSQGAIMALDAVATARWPLAGVVAFSGRLAGPAPLGPNSHGSAALHQAGGADPDGQVSTTDRLSPVLLIHGANDQVIAASETLQARARLAALGHQAHKVVLPGLGHAIDARGLSEASDFLKQLLCADGAAAARSDLPAAQ